MEYYKICNFEISGTSTSTMITTTTSTTSSTTTTTTTVSPSQTGDGSAGKISQTLLLQVLF